MHCTTLSYHYVSVAHKTVAAIALACQLVKNALNIACHITWVKQRHPWSCKKNSAPWCLHTNKSDQVLSTGVFCSSITAADRCFSLHLYFISQNILFTFKLPSMGALFGSTFTLWSLLPLQLQSLLHLPFSLVTMLHQTCKVYLASLSITLNSVTPKLACT